MIGRPIFDYTAEFRAPEGEGCTTCGIVLKADAIGSYCSPECCEWADRCVGCDRGQTWCECEYTHCIDCDVALSDRDIEQHFRTCRTCASIRQQIRFDLGPSHRRPSDSPSSRRPSDDPSRRRSAPIQPQEK